jgi:proline dehydrogenase
MGGGYPGSGRGTHQRTTVSDVPVRPGSPLHRLVGERLFGRALGIPDVVPLARTLVDEGRRVGLEHRPGPGEDLEAALVALVHDVRTAGLAAECELTVPVDRLGPAGALRVGRAATGAGLSAVLAGPPAAVGAVDLPPAGVVVPAGEDGAEDRCRALARGHVRLVRGPSAPGHRAATDLAFVRCLNVLMAEEGRPGIAASDPRLIAIAGERAAWNGRTPDSWELVMPYGVLTHEQERLVAAGNTVRVTVTQVAGGRS